MTLEKGQELLRGRELWVTKLAADAGGDCGPLAVARVWYLISRQQPYVMSSQPSHLESENLESSGLELPAIWALGPPR